MYWCCSRLDVLRLQLNTTKTEVLWSTISRYSHQLLQLSLLAGSNEMTPSSVVRDLKVYIDGDVSVMLHVTETSHSGCHSADLWCRISSVAFADHYCNPFLLYLVLSLLYYGTLIMVQLLLAFRSVCVSGCSRWWTRLVFSALRYDPITLLLLEGHWADWLQVGCPRLQVSALGSSVERRCHCWTR